MDTYKIPAPAMQEPMTWLKDRLALSGLSSLEMERMSGVPGSTIRSILNGRRGTVGCVVWCALMCWVLEGMPDRRRAA